MSPKTKLWPPPPPPESDIPLVGASLTELGEGQYEGQRGILRIGAHPDLHQEQFIWDGTAGLWIGAREYVVLSALDAWAMDWSRQSLTLARNKWTRPNGGVSWQIRGPRAQLTADVTFPQASIPFENAAVGSFDPAAQVLIRDVLVTYTGITTADATHGTFTGCTNHSAHNGKTMPADHTPIIPYGQMNGGDEGGWGTSVVMLDRVGEMWAAGFRLEERLDGFFNGTTDLTAVDFAAFYQNADAGEDLGASTNYPGTDKSADQIPGLLGPGVTVTGPAYDMAGYTVPGTHKAYQERGFERRTSAWTPWVAAAPAKRFLQPILYARHTAAAKNTGEAYSVNLMLRWTGTPA